MKTSDDLFQLIKSLSSNEKGYFKKSASKHVRGKKNNYVRLFEAIDKQNSYNENKILQKFKKETLVKHLPSAKNYLYRLILNALNDYHADKSAVATIREQLGFIANLKRKRLYKQTLKQLEKAKKMTQKYEQYNYWLQILEEEITIHQEVKSEKGAFLIQKLQVEADEIIVQIQINQTYQKLYNTVFWAANQQIFATNEQQIQHFERILQNELLQKKNIPTTFTGQMLYFKIQQICYYQTHQMEKSRVCAKQMIELCEAYPHFVKESPFAYLALLNNWIVSCFLMKNWEELFEVAQKIKALPVGSKHEEVRQFTTVYNAELTYFTQQNNLEKINQTIKAAKVKLEEYGDLVAKASRLVWFFNFSNIYFIFKAYDLSLEWMNRFLNLYETGIREEIYNKAVFVNLAIHYELGNERLLESLIRQVYRYTQQKAQTYQFEKILLQFFKKLLNLPLAAKKTKTLLCKSTLQQLGAIEGEVEQRLLANFAVMTWLEGKVAI